MREGRPLPERIQNAPELELGLGFYYVAFEDLQSCRSSAFGVGYIPWTAMRAYCDEYGVEGEDREDFYHMVRALDAAYVKFMSK